MNEYFFSENEYFFHICHRQMPINLFTLIRLGPLLMRMSRMKSASICLLLFASLVVPFSTSVGAAGPKASMVDFTISDISIGNASVSAMQWTQPDGSTIDYFINEQPLPILVTYKQAGNDIGTKQGTGFIEIWHPVGVKLTEWNFSLDLSGGQTVLHEVVWTPTAAHSMLAENGTLSGGYIVRASVDGGPFEEDPSNDVVDELVPIAVYYSNMDSGVCGDNDGDSQSDCQYSSTTYYNPMFASIGYDHSTGSPDGYGPWMLDNSSSFSGSTHWRHSVPGQDYVSNGNDQLVWGWFVPGADPCDDPGHGLGYGSMSSEISNAYSVAYCKVSLVGSKYLTLQFSTQVWGGMGSNDEVSIAATSAGYVVSQKNLSDSGVSSSTDDWTQVIWDLNDNLNRDFSLSYLFESDQSGATSGFHIDDFALFGVQKVPEYTITVVCDNPETGYSAIPADPMPPSLHCTLTNNGYSDKVLRIDVTVDNQTWMNQYSPIRIDSNNLNDHDNSVPLNAIDYNETTEFWVNLTIPPGANVETLNWNVSIVDAYTGESKHEMVIPLTVIAAYSVDITYFGSVVASNLEPGESDLVKFRLTNTGNQMAYWNLGAFFNRTEWTSAHYRFLDAEVNGSEISFMQLSKAESRDFWAEFTAPTEIEPCMTEITILASGQSPANAQKTRKVNVEVVQVHDITMVPSESSVTAGSDMNTRTVEVEITNNGNSPERFSIEVSAEWALEVSSTHTITEEVNGFGDSTSFYVIMPMPYGIRPDIYFINVKATSQDDPSFFETLQIELNVEPTYLINVESVNMSGQTFQGGADSKTISFEVTNNGNDYDEFLVELDVPDGMNADIISNDQYDPTSPPSVAKGASVNVTVQYSFDVGVNGLLELVVSAKSLQSGDANIGSTGSATFQVGSQGWLEMTPGQLVSIDSDGWVLANLTVHNRHPTNQQFITLEIQAGQERQYASARVASDDSSFVLDVDQKRSVSIKFTLTETQYLNLPEDNMIFNITVIASGSDDVSEAVVQVQVIKESESKNDDSEKGFSFVNIAAFSIGGIVIIALIVILAKVVISTNREEDEIIQLGGYQRQLEETYGSMPAAPEIPIASMSSPAAPALPVTDTVANSAYGGAADIFEQQVTPAPAPQTPANAQPAGSPPLPPGGLPDGWTMEQWVHYGAEYRQQHGLD